MKKKKILKAFIGWCFAWVFILAIATISSKEESFHFIWWFDILGGVVFAMIFTYFFDIRPKRKKEAELSQKSEANSNTEFRNKMKKISFWIVCALFGLAITILGILVIFHSSFVAPEMPAKIHKIDCESREERYSSLTNTHGMLMAICKGPFREKSKNDSATNDLPTRADYNNVLEEFKLLYGEFKKDTFDCDFPELEPLERLLE
jgi:uncharacterized membrane protein